MRKLLLASLLLCGCDERQLPEAAQVVVAQPQLEQARFSVTLLAEFPDESAYGGKRRIYEITDSLTKTTYLSVTGMGLDRLRKDRDDELADAALDIALDVMGD